MAAVSPLINPEIERTKQKYWASIFNGKKPPKKTLHKVNGCDMSDWERNTDEHTTSRWELY